MSLSSRGFCTFQERPPTPRASPPSYLRSPRTGTAGAWRGAGCGPWKGGSDWKWAAGTACPNTPWCHCLSLRGGEVQKVTTHGKAQQATVIKW